MQTIQRFIRWFLPAEEHFFDHVEAAARATDDAVRYLVELCSAPDERRVELIEKARDAEREADKAMRDMADALDRTFVTPLDREDLYALTSTIESVSDIALATASQVDLHDIEVLPDGSVELAEILARSTARIREAVPLLRTGRNHEDIRKHCAAIERLEHDADVVFRRVIAARFTSEKDAVKLLKDKEFLEGLENSVDRCASVARVLESILIKNG
jgi:uncharacterized protein Yka (UPF0111/DUF47 family)